MSHPLCDPPEWRRFSQRIKLLALLPECTRLGQHCRMSSENHSPTPGFSRNADSGAGWRLDHSYAGLPGLLHDPCAPIPVRQPRLFILNRPLAVALGLDPDVLEREDQAEIFAGNRLPDGAQPLAQAYAGHQFGHFTGLGDGRALLLGEQVTPDGRRFDIQLKGSGPTRFSRRGDGRAALGPMLREFVISEAMHALGIPTTRSLAVATTGETVMRMEALPGAVLTRVAASHIRVGTFEWVAAHQDPGVLRTLVQYALHRHFPEHADSETPAHTLLEAVIESQARLIARWMHVGFIHGVMNTDNMAISGETIDYGPCAFMDAHDPDTVFSSIDHHGRYAYGRQPEIARWNLARFAETLLPVLHADGKRAVELANAALHGFEPTYTRHWLAGMRAKLGLFTAEDDDLALVQHLLDWMHQAKADHTKTFRGLAESGDRLPLTDPGFSEWQADWKNRLARQPQSTAEVRELMRQHNPAVIPRNHKVEEALEAAQHGDPAPLRKLLELLADPYKTPAPRDAEFLEPSPDASYQTFCGT
jgi:serine/tyrosine/threonine adenylyltransferase